MAKRLNPIFVGAPAWIVTFADLATLLLTFFVLMLSFANVDIVKFKELMGSAQEAYGVTKEEHGGFQAVSKGRFADTRPLFSNDLEETRPLNRRVAKEWVPKRKGNR